MGDLMLIAGLLMLVALAASLLAGRLRVPGLLLFLGIGMLIGSDGLGWIDFKDFELARDIGVVALALILFEGGLTTRVDDLKAVAVPAVSLAILGTLLTAFIAGLAASYLFDLSLLEGLLLGSIIASTDVAAIFALLRGSGLKKRLALMLEGEAGSNDPVAILLVIGLIDWILLPGYGFPDMARLFVEQLAIGAIVGVAIGWLGARALRAAELPTLGLYPVATLTAAALTFGLAEVLGGSGFLAVYLTALTMSASQLPARRTVTSFHAGLAWVSQLSLFLVLGLLVFPSQLGGIAVEGTLLALILIFVARPVASVVATSFTSLNIAERILLGWAGLRGAIPVVLATFPVIAGVAEGIDYFNIIFFAVLLSLVVQGPTFEPLARRLGLTTVEPIMPEPLSEVGTIRGLGAEVVEFEVAEGDAANGASIRDLSLPREAVVNVIVRGNEAIPPRGSTRIEAGDRMHLLIRREVSDAVERQMTRWRTGPLGPPERPKKTLRGSPPVFTIRPRTPESVEGEPRSPERVVGVPVVLLLRMRRDSPGSLVALEDGRYAMVGKTIAVGARRDVADYATRRLHGDSGVSPGDRNWLINVVGDLSVDAFD